MRKNPHRIENPENHTKIVIRRRNPIEIVKKQLTKANGEPKFLKCEDTRVIYASPLVDVAANLELARETVEICKVILQLTNWEIRLLSKSNLLPKIADALSEYKNRIIYGVSTGNLNDRIAAAYERGTPKVSKRLESLWWLQDNGYRTFGMICPSLPLESDLDYDRFAVDCAKAIRADRCEHVWAEVINVRGESFERTKTALNEAGFNAEAELLEAVTYDKAAWEAYARKTFEAHAKVYESQPGKLRFLQYVNKSSRAEYWNSQVARGAVLL
jgi:DNA repair photolyase